MAGLINELAKNNIKSASTMDWDLSGKVYYLPSMPHNKFLNSQLKILSMKL
jgi:hypothetical protein